MIWKQDRNCSWANIFLFLLLSIPMGQNELVLVIEHTIKVFIGEFYAAAGHSNLHPKRRWNILTCTRTVNTMEKWQNHITSSSSVWFEPVGIGFAVRCTHTMSPLACVRITKFTIHKHRNRVWRHTAICIPMVVERSMSAFPFI